MGNSYLAERAQMHEITAIINMKYLGIVIFIKIMSVCISYLTSFYILDSDVSIWRLSHVSLFSKRTFTEQSIWDSAATNDAEENALLAQVMALSQQEFLNSLKQAGDGGSDLNQAGSSKSIEF